MQIVRRHECLTIGCPSLFSLDALCGCPEASARWIKLVDFRSRCPTLTGPKPTFSARQLDSPNSLILRFAIKGLDFHGISSLREATSLRFRNISYREHPQQGRLMVLFLFSGPPLKILLGPQQRGPLKLRVFPRFSTRPSRTRRPEREAGGRRASAPEPRALPVPAPV